MGMPGKDLDDYDKYQIGQIDVYVRADIVALEDDTIYVDYYKLLWIEKMALRGVRF